MSERVLLVDDEPNVLRAYQRVLRKRFVLSTAGGGAEALESFAQDGPVAVIVSDMRMPGMSGLELLMKVRERSPDTVRIMLTGNADQQTAVDAVNKGSVFRFVTKPCAPEQLASVIDAGLERYRRLTAEKSLLQDTVRGALGAIGQLLALANPAAFGRSDELRELLGALVDGLGMERPWWLEPLAALSRMGGLLLPEALFTKVAQGDPLSPEEQQKFLSYPDTCAELISSIPRMDVIAESLRHQERHYDGRGPGTGGPAGEDLPLGARLLKVALDYQRLRGGGLAAREAVARMHWQQGRYDPRILAALEALLEDDGSGEAMEVDLMGLEDGMVLVQDVRAKDGTLLVSKGQTVRPIVRNLLCNFSEQGNLRLPLVVARAAKGRLPA